VRRKKLGAMQRIYPELTREIGELRFRLEKLVTDRDFELSVEDSAICFSFPKGSIVQVVRRGCSLFAAMKLISNYQLLSVDIRLDCEG